MGFARTSAMIRDSRKSDMHYAIYTFPKDDCAQSQGQWKMQGIESGRDAALIRAEMLFATGAYCKVEIKERRTLPGDTAPTDRTIRILQGRRPASFRRWLSGGVLAMAGIASVLTVLGHH